VERDFADETVPSWLIAAALIAPVCGLALLLGVPSFDVHWEHHPSHFGLVLGVAVLNVGLGLIASQAAHQRQDVRLFLVSMVLLASAGFLALHALATPGVVLERPNGGFTLATPVGLLIASGFAAWSALDPGPREAALRRRQPLIRAALFFVLLAWLLVSLLEVPPLDRPVDAERAPWLLVILPFGMAAYAFAAWRYVELFRARRRALPLAVATAFVLLAEALAAIAVGRAWHLSWWEWHILMAAAFTTILLAARHEYRAERSLVQAFDGLYLERTLERIDAQQRDALLQLARAEDGRPLERASADLRERGLTGEEISVLVRSSRQLRQADALLRRYLGPHLAERLGADPEASALGGDERDVSVLFADLAGFTSFAEGRPAPEVIDMLNSYWSEIVPAVIENEGGVVERFAGDAILVVFNALGDQPDHAVRAARAAIAIRDASDRPSETDRPRFRVGVNSGPAAIGNVGAGQQRSFAAIGDTTNVAARLQDFSRPGHVTIGERTLREVRERSAVVEVEDLGPMELKGKAGAVEAYELLRIG